MNASSPNPDLAPAPPCLQPPSAENQWFKQEVQPHEPALRRFLSSKYPHLSEVDDVVQESFLEAFLAWQKGTLHSARGFIFKVARNSVISRFRKSWRISPTPVSEIDDWRVLQTDENVAETACTKDQIANVTAAFAELPGACRKVMLLRFTQGLEVSEIADQLGHSEKTVRTQLSRGMRKCTEYLRERGILEEGKR